MPYKDPVKARDYSKAARLKRWAEDPDRERKKEAEYRAKARSKADFQEYNRRATQIYYQQNKEWRSFQIRLRHYELTLDQYHALYEGQDFCCAICGTMDPGRNDIRGLLYIDHDHDTGRVRGLLCHGCNTALGGFKDDPGIMTSAIEYVHRYKMVEINDAKEMY